MELILWVLISLFVLAFLFFGSMVTKGENQDNVVIVETEQLSKINDRQDYVFIGNSDKQALFEKLVKAGATEAEALKFIS